MAHHAQTWCRTQHTAPLKDTLEKKKSEMVVARICGLLVLVQFSGRLKLWDHGENATGIFYIHPPVIRTPGVLGGARGAVCVRERRGKVLRLTQA